MSKEDSFSRLVDKQGFLTKEGRAYVDENFGSIVDSLLNIATTTNQRRIIGGILKNVIGTKIADNL